MNSAIKKAEQAKTNTDAAHRIRQEAKHAKSKSQLIQSALVACGLALGRMLTAQADEKQVTIVPPVDLALYQRASALDP